MDVPDMLVEVLERFKEFSRAMIEVTFEKFLFRNKLDFLGWWGYMNLLFILDLQTWRRWIIAWNDVSSLIQDVILSCNCGRN